MSKNRKALYEQCRKKLLEAKERHLQAFRSYATALSAHISGDDADVATAIEDQDLAVTRREKVLAELKEIELALERIENGTYGNCEETEEPIEKERLLLIPWTRLSLEGAIMREKERKQRRVGAV
jgi:DnaK suppressor protein